MSEIQDSALRGLERRGRQSKKYTAMLVGVVAFLALAFGALASIVEVARSAPGIDLAAFAAALTSPLTAVSAPLSLLILGYVGGTSWQEKAVRVAAMGATKPEAKP